MLVAVINPRVVIWHEVLNPSITFSSELLSALFATMLRP